MMTHTFTHNQDMADNVFFLVMIILKQVLEDSYKFERKVKAVRVTTLFFTLIER